MLNKLPVLKTWFWFCLIQQLLFFNAYGCSHIQIYTIYFVSELSHPLTLGVQFTKFCWLFSGDCNVFIYTMFGSYIISNNHLHFPYPIDIRTVFKCHKFQYETHWRCVLLHRRGLYAAIFSYLPLQLSIHFHFFDLSSNVPTLRHLSARFLSFPWCLEWFEFWMQYIEHLLKNWDLLFMYNKPWKEKLIDLIRICTLDLYTSTDAILIWFLKFFDRVI